MLKQVSVTHLVVQILGKTQTEVYKISGLLVKFLINKSWHKSRTSGDIDMKLRPVSKLGMRKKKTTKTLTITSC